MKLCVCLTEQTLQECKEFVSTSDSDLIEHRMDFMGQISGLSEIYSATDTPIIATCRSKVLGGNFQGNESTRIDYLLEAIQNGASYVDVEIETKREHLELVRKTASLRNCQLIVSKHYTKFTPEYPELLDLLSKMKDCGADIIKLVVTPDSIRDCQRVLQLYSLESLETPLIAFAMGARGRFTRVSALFMGAPFMYVSQDSGKEAAAGQISLSEMRSIVRSLS